MWHNPFTCATGTFVRNDGHVCGEEGEDDTPRCMRDTLTLTLTGDRVKEGQTSADASDKLVTEGVRRPHVE